MQFQSLALNIFDPDLQLQVLMWLNQPGQLFVNLNNKFDFGDLL